MRYLIVGAHAVAFHARPRATKDLDILLDATPDNANRALAALNDFFGGAGLGYAAADLLDPRSIIQLGVAPVRIDLMSSIPGCSDFEAAWKNRVQARFGSVPTYYLGLADLLRAKEAAGRPQDCADAQMLRRAHVLTRGERRPRRRRGKRGGTRP